MTQICINCQKKYQLSFIKIKKCCVSKEIIKSETAGWSLREDIEIQVLDKGLRMYEEFLQIKKKTI